MKKLILFLGLILPFIANAQIYQRDPSYGKIFNRIQIAPNSGPGSLILPVGDTLADTNIDDIQGSILFRTEGGDSTLYIVVADANAASGYRFKKVGSGQAAELRTITITSSISLTNSYDVVFCNGTGSGPSGTIVTLPNASGIAGRTYLLKRINTGTVTVISAGGTIDGNSSYVLSTTAGNEFVSFISDGTNWKVANRSYFVYTAGTGISLGLGGNVITNTAPDQTVSLSNGTGISVTGTYPNFTITNTIDGTGFINNGTSLQDPASFNISSNGYIGGALGVGTTTPDFTIHSFGQISASNSNPFGSGSGGRVGAYAVGLPTSSSQLLGAYYFGSNVNGSYINSASIEATSGGAWTEDSDYSSGLNFYTTRPGQTLTDIQMIISPDGIITMPTQPAGINNKLNVIGKISSVTSGIDNIMSMSTVGTDNAGLSFSADNTYDKIIQINGTNGRLDISGNSLTNLSILNDGKVGINTTSPTSQLDINGIGVGYAQLRLRVAYTPSGTADTNGNAGDVSWDDNYIYIKTSAGWKRAALTTF